MLRAVDRREQKRGMVECFKISLYMYLCVCLCAYVCLCMSACCLLQLKRFDYAKAPAIAFAFAFAIAFAFDFVAFLLRLLLPLHLPLLLLFPLSSWILLNAVYWFWMPTPTKVANNFAKLLCILIRIFITSPLPRLPDHCGPPPWTVSQKRKIFKLPANVLCLANSAYECALHAHTHTYYGML